MWKGLFSKMKAIIKKQNLKEEFYISEKCYAPELSNSADDQDLSIARARVEPGVTTGRHRLKGITERGVAAVRDNPAACP